MTRRFSGTFSAILTVAFSLLLALPCNAAILPTASNAGDITSAGDASYQLRDGIPFETIDGESLVADLYLPKGKGPFPAILFLHGGGWRNGTRKQLRRQAALMAQHGFVGFAIEYRLAPKHPYPAGLEDAKAGVRWLRHHAKEYDIDPNRIAAVGSSAGGHLAAMLGVESILLPSSRRTRDKDDASVQAVVAFNGIFDISAMPPSTMVSDFLGAECAAAPQRCAEASPISNVHPGLPPFLILHGTADKTAPYSQALAFTQLLKQNHDAAEIFTADGAPHSFWAQPKWLALSFAAMQAFLLRTLH